MKIKELRELPHRKWSQKEAYYKTLSVINSGKKHDSGFALMYIIGWEDGKPKEIISSCDHIIWQLGGKELEHDMLYPSGIKRFWVYHHLFCIDYPSSTIKISLINQLTK